MNYFLLFLSVFTDTFKNIYYNQFGNKVLKTIRDALMFNAVCGVGAVGFFLCTGCGFKSSAYSLVLALVFAIVTAGAQFFSLMAMFTGSMSFSVLFTYLGMIIPTVFGMIAYRQTPGILQIIGLALMLVTLYLSSGIKKGENLNLKWLFFALGSFVLWGLVGIIQQIHQNSDKADEINVFLLWSFLFLTAIFAVMTLLSPKAGCNYRLKSKSTLPSLISGVIIGAVNLINLYLSGKISSIVLFPILNGGVIVLSGLAALFLFKEKLTRSQYAGIILGTLAICLLGI